MNLLAHAFLAGRRRDAIVGGLVADFVGARTMATLPEGVKRGVLLHRAVDAFTDRHDLVRASVARVKPRWGRYAAVVIDVLFDHFLAARWSRFSDEPLVAFTRFVYDEVEASWPKVPPRATYPLRRMIDDDWLGSYVALEGVASTLRRIEGRVRFRVPGATVDLGGVDEAMREDGAFLDGAFDRFFPDLVGHVSGLEER